MANKKITQLPASTTPLTGSEIVPVVQSGATVQTSVNSLGPGIGYTPAGTGAVARTVQAKLRETISVEDFALNVGLLLLVMVPMLPSFGRNNLRARLFGFTGVLAVSGTLAFRLLALGLLLPTPQVLVCSLSVKMFRIAPSFGCKAVS